MSDDDDERGNLTGTILAERYRLIRLVKEGGMGAVYEAEDTKLGRRLAVKILSPEFTRQPDMVRRFFREAKAPSFAQHPNIVTYHDFNQIEGGVAYLVMEYLEGDDLERVLKRRGPLPWPELAPLMLQSCRALQAAHAAGIIHRDIKPSNFILLDRSFADGPPIIKLIDFGIAKFTEESRLHSHTEVTQHLMGSQRFIAPEMYAMVPANPRTDIYALGVTMYRLLTGKYPEAGGGYDMVPPSDLRPDAGIPPEVDELILRAVAVNPYARFADMGELEDALLGHIRRPEPVGVGLRTIPPSGTTGPLPVLRDPTSATIAHRRNRRRWLPVAGLTGLAAVLVAATWQIVRIQEPARQESLAVAPPAAMAPSATTPVEPAPTGAPEPPPKTSDDAVLPPKPEPELVSVPETPPLDMKLVDQKLASKTKAVSKCGRDDGLFPGMRLTVSVRIDQAGKPHPTVEKAGNHPYVQCIKKQIQGLKFGLSSEGGKRTIVYTI